MIWGQAIIENADPDDKPAHIECVLIGPGLWRLCRGIGDYVLRVNICRMRDRTRRHWLVVVCPLACK